jgi:hypothetical protein
VCYKAHHKRDPEGGMAPSGLVHACKIPEGCQSTDKSGIPFLRHVQLIQYYASDDCNRTCSDRTSAARLKPIALYHPMHDHMFAPAFVTLNAVPTLPASFPTPPMTLAADPERIADPASPALSAAAKAIPGSRSGCTLGMETASATASIVLIPVKSMARLPPASRPQFGETWGQTGRSPVLFPI